MCCILPKCFSKTKMASVQASSSSSSSSKKDSSSKPSANKKDKKAQVELFAAALKKKGIKLLALDFDRTLVDVHSRGQWTDATEKLVSFVRPCMKDLLLAASKKDLFLSIVTYSSQKGLIKEVLHSVLPKKVASTVYVVANTPEFLARNSSHDFNGKEAHIATVISSIDKDHKVGVKKNEVLLMDDDLDNVRRAVSSGHYGFHVQQSVDYASFESFQTMLLL